MEINLFSFALAIFCFALLGGLLATMGEVVEQKKAVEVLNQNDYLILQTIDSRLYSVENPKCYFDFVDLVNKQLLLVCNDQTVYAIIDANQLDKFYEPAQKKVKLI